MHILTILQELIGLFWHGWHTSRTNLSSRWPTSGRTISTCWSSRTSHNLWSNHDRLTFSHGWCALCLTPFPSRSGHRTISCLSFRNYCQSHVNRRRAIPVAGALPGQYPGIVPESKSPSEVCTPLSCTLDSQFCLSISNTWQNICSWSYKYYKGVSNDNERPSQCKIKCCYMSKEVRYLQQSSPAVFASPPVIPVRKNCNTLYKTKNQTNFFILLNVLFVYIHHITYNYVNKPYKRLIFEWTQ